MNLLKKIIVALLTLESRLILAKYKPFIVAVTGSVGKTSTKDAIYTVLKNQSAHVRKSDKSMNSDIGLPLTVIGVPNAWKDIGGWIDNLMTGLKLILRKSEYPDTLILEIGADHPGDIRKVAAWLRADIVVITQVSSTPVHVEFFSSPEEVFEEKASLVHALKNGGSLILLADNQKVMSIAQRTKDMQVKVVSFGGVQNADVRGTNSEVSYESATMSGGISQLVPSGLDFTVTIDGSSHPVKLKGIIGRTYMYPLLAAVAVGYAKHIPTDIIMQNIKTYEAPRGRMRIIPGINDSILIDDTYNSSPDAALSALETLKSIATPGIKVAILADMMELGQYSSEQHRTIGAYVMGAAQILLTVGQRSRATADAALSAGMSPDMIHSFDTAGEAAAYIKPLIKNGDVLLIKGSQSLRMERVVTALMRDPDRASDLLVRQEPEWLER